MEESKKMNAVIDVIMLAGTILLRNGSEIHRVEDTMIRIAHSQGIMDCNVLAMPAAVFFSIMFGGNFYDALGAGVATLFGFTFSLYVEKLIRIPFMTAFAGALIFGLIAQVWARYSGLPSTADLIIAGAVMPFVPGIALTNAVRDIMTNHINSGMSKMFESLLVTLALGAGTSVALVLMN